jgi:plastocyanin
VFDPGEWIGAGDAPSDVYGCMDVFGLNFNSEATADDGSCTYADHQVEAGSMYFSPADLSINMGESVQWNNVDGNHDVVADDGSFDFDACTAPCLIGSHTFSEAGTYSYICSMYGHAEQGMVGTVTVVDPTVDVTFSVDMSIEGVVGDVKVRTSTIDGEYSPSDWFVMDDSDSNLGYILHL